MASYSCVVLHCVSLPFGKNLPSTSHLVHRLPNEWVCSPQPWCGTQSSHYHSPALLWHGIFFFVHFGCSIGGRIYFWWIISTSVFIYLLLDLNHSLLPLHSLPVGCTVRSHALCINILEIYRSVLYFLYCWILIIKTFTLGYWINLVLLENKRSCFFVFVFFCDFSFWRSLVESFSGPGEISVVESIDGSCRRPTLGY